jgi:lipoprotein-releasing system ATP-binding protein
MPGSRPCRGADLPLCGARATSRLERLRQRACTRHGAAVLNVSNVSKSYPTPRGELPILAGVSLTLERGAAIAIMGPSGSGKSTLLYILGALEPPTSGTVTLDGENPYALNEREQAAFRNRRIGFVFQDHSLLPQCSVLENVLAPTLVAPAGERDAEARARALLAQVGLGERLDHRPAELSGGEKQRAALARALIRNPVLLLCDEPTGNLDRASADTVANLLLELHAARETILVVVTHSAALAAKFPVQYEMDGGRLT